MEKIITEKMTEKEQETIIKEFKKLLKKHNNVTFKNSFNENDIEEQSCYTSASGCYAGIYYPNNEIKYSKFNIVCLCKVNNQFGFIYETFQTAFKSFASFDYDPTYEDLKTKLEKNIKFYSDKIELYNSIKRNYKKDNTPFKDIAKNFKIFNPITSKDEFITVRSEISLNPLNHYYKIEFGNYFVNDWFTLNLNHEITIKEVEEGIKKYKDMYIKELEETKTKLQKLPSIYKEIKKYALKIKDVFKNNDMTYLFDKIININM